MTRDELRAIIISEGLGRAADQIVEAAKPCFRLQTSSFNGTELADVSKIGGNPGLPTDIEWPYWNNKPLAFLAQIRLRDLAAFDFGPLPKKGYLSFFYDLDQSTWGFDAKDNGSFRVLYSEAETGDLESRTFPHPELLFGGGPYCGPRQVRFQPLLSLPPWQSLFVASLNLVGAESELYIDMVENNESLAPECPKHQLLGHPFPIQNEMQTECQLVTHGLYCGDVTGHNDSPRVSPQEGALEWQLLMQIDTDDDAGMMWGDCGMLYFWIREQDLKNRAFEKAWMILQCS